jgi:uncharacterized membrane protein
MEPLHDENDRTRKSRLGLALMMLVSGVLHFLIPRPYMRIVPRVLGHARFWVYVSGVAELAAGGLLLSRRTKRAGGWAAAATIVAVYPANIQMALDARSDQRRLYRLGCWARLPMQFPMIGWALSQI